jgi:NAD(P)-dependent dehydrogenase (short-subunit alcohol dehydrogenase family)
VVATYPDLRERVVVVTGAAGGIGRAIAEQFAAQGSRVVAVGRSEPPLRELVAELERDGVEAAAVTCDISQEHDAQAMVAEAVERFGGIDVLVNNAGTFQAGARVGDMDVGEWERVIATNLTGTMLCCKHAAPELTRRPGAAIVNVGSLSGHVPRLGNAAYAASKAAVEHLTRTLALELARDGVRVNAVTPGSTDTPMLAQAIERDGEDGPGYRVAGDPSLFRSPIPLGRVARVEEQAAPVVFLASGAAGFMTGQVLGVDGGEAMA